MRGLGPAVVMTLLVMMANVTGALAQDIAVVTAGDADAGGNVFRRCGACHAVGEGARNKVGPHLNGLFGRVAGSIEDYRYSKPMREAGKAGLVWDEEALVEYLRRPRAFVKGTSMGFAGLRKDKDIIDVLTFLGTHQNSK